MGGGYVSKEPIEERESVCAIREIGKLKSFHVVTLYIKGVTLSFRSLLLNLAVERKKSTIFDVNHRGVSCLY